MDSFLPHYDSTVFSIILTIFIIIALILVTYGWSLYLQQRSKSQLMEFLERFDSASCVLEGSDLPFDESMSKPLLLLAKAFETSGEYHKSISIYLYLIKNGKNNELLEQLGKVYLRAGFLERAESIFLQIIAKNPRNIPVLYQLGHVYELLQSYDKAIETLEPLEVQGEEVGMLRAFWKFEKLQLDETLSKEEKTSALIEIINKEPTLYRLAIAALFYLDSDKGWQHLQLDRVAENLDLLWYLPPYQLDFDIIQQYEALTKIFFARGDVKQIDPTLVQKNSASVGIDILVAARFSGEMRGEIGFGYLCSTCKQSFPIAFKRCPNCLAINSAQLEEHIAKHEETDYTLF